MTDFTPKLQVPAGHTGRIEGVAISPDRKWIATSDNSSMKLWDANFRLVRTIHSGGSSIVFTKDGSGIIGFLEKRLTRWDTASGAVVYSKELAASVLKIIEVDRQEKLLACREDAIALLDPANGEILMPFVVLEDAAEERGPIMKAAFSKQKHQIIAVCKSGGIYSIDISTGNSKRIAAVDLDIDDLTIAADGAHILLFGTEEKNPQAEQALILYNLETGAQSKLLLPTKSVSFHLYMFFIFGVSPDGKQAYLVSGYDKVLCQWDLNDSSQPPRLIEFENEFRSGTFSEDFSCLVGYILVSAWKFELSTGRVLCESGGANALLQTKVSSEGSKLLIEAGVVSDGGVAKVLKMLPLDGDSLVQELTDNLLSEYYSSIAISPDGSRAFFQLYDQEASLQARSAELKNADDLTLKVKGESIIRFAVSPDGNSVAIAVKEPLPGYGAIQVFDLKKEALKVSFSFSDSNTRAKSISFSQDGQQLVSVDNQDNIRAWNIDTGKQEGPAMKHEAVTSAVFSPGHGPSELLSGGENGDLILWNLESGTPVRRFVMGPEAQTGDEQHSIEAISFLENGAKVVAGTVDGVFQVWKTETGQSVCYFKERDADVFAEFFPKVSIASLSHEGRTLLLTSSGGTCLNIWDYEAETGNRIASLYILDEENWVVITPSGLFDASPGAMKRMHFVVGLEIVELDQLKDRYYHPKLLPTLLSSGEVNLTNVAALNVLHLYPELRSMDIENGQLQVELQERSGGIGKTSLYIGPCEVEEDINPGRKAEFSVDLAKEKYRNYYVEGDNKITIRLHNKEGWLKSQAHTRDYSYKSEGQTRSEPALYGIFVGTSHYNNRQLSLTYPDQDAAYLRDAFGTAGKKLFEERVDLRLLTTDDRFSTEYSSRENIRRAFEEVAQKARPQDVMLVYFSGHGANRGTGENARYYYLTGEVTSGNLDDKTIRDTRTISSEEITGWLNKIPARKQVLIFDTCHSGRMLDALKSKDALDTVRERALERMKDRTGTFILAGSAADKVSYEASNYGHGLLTYTLLRGMKGVDLNWEPRDGYPTVEIGKLLSNARETVPGLAADLSAAQVPVLRVPEQGEKIYVGISTDEIQRQIKLAMPQPIFVRSNFMNAATFFDDLHMSDIMDQHIAESFSKGRGPRAIFIPIHRFPDAFTVRGLYQKTADGYEVKGRIYKDRLETESWGDFTISGKGVGDIVPRIGFEVEKLVLDSDNMPQWEREELVEKTLANLQEIKEATGKDKAFVGYKEDFLGENIPLPTLTEEQKEDAAKLIDNDQEMVLDYQYYSLVQSKSRKLPYFTACNFHGANFVQCDRKGSFIIDDRILEEDQLGDEFYKARYREDDKKMVDKKDRKSGKITKVEKSVPYYLTDFLDRGHMTKREDTQWAKGDKKDSKTIEMAERGARLTFFFTNAVPQVGRFNRGAWKKLEDYIMETANPGKKGKTGDNYKVNIFTGPVFKADDPEITIEVGQGNNKQEEQVKIPVLFWKIVYFKKAGDNQLWSVGFLMGQEDLFRGSYKSFTGLEAKEAFTNFKMKDGGGGLSQVSIAHIEALTGLSFPRAKDPHKGKKKSPIVYQMKPAPLKKKGLSVEEARPAYTMQGLNLG